ncbi:MAG TPA: TOBE domain-containing protein [Candidatus Eisenbacteria bacterium]|nr:TOBE domain-containing protein [Candidatus Eisenbacteria bacterium]
MDTLDVRQTADLLHMRVKRVQSLARSGKLPALRVGRRWLFPRAEMERFLRKQATPTLAAQPESLDLSARNRLRGRVAAIHADGLMAEVVVSIGDQELVSLITRSSAERLGLRVGSNVVAIVKSTEVIIGRDGPDA